MEFSLKQFLIAVPLCFLGGFVDSIGGGGGLITLPAFMLAGLPAHISIGTNKIQAFLCNCMSTARMWKSKKIVFRLAVPTVIAAFAGSACGAKLNTMVSDRVLSYFMLAALPLISIVVFNKRLFSENEGEMPEVNVKTAAVMTAISLVVGFYDGFYGPGTGTFLIIGFCVLAHLGVSFANGHAKIVNLATSIASMTVYLLNGQSVILLGVCAGLAAMAGSYIGSGLVLKNGARAVRPVIIFVIILLMIKIITGF